MVSEARSGAGGLEGQVALVTGASSGLGQAVAVALAELEETRSTAEHQLATVQNRREAIEALGRDRDALLEHYAAIARRALDGLTLEERHHLYRMLRLEVVVRPDTNPEVGGSSGRRVR